MYHVCNVIAKKIEWNPKLEIVITSKKENEINEIIADISSKEKKEIIADMEVFRLVMFLQVYIKLSIHR